MSDVQTKGLFGTALPPFLAKIQAHNQAYNAALVAADTVPMRAEDLRTVAQAVVEAWTMHHLHHLAHATEALCAQMQALAAVLREGGDPMTTEEIRALDGTALKRLAWEYGLAPGDIQPLPGQEQSLGRYLFDSPRRQNYTVLDVWQPHKNIDQAEGIFRSLRAKGWDTFRGYDAQHQFGWVTAFKARINATWECQWRMAVPTEEPLALLRCAVLAVASEVPTP